MAQTQQVHTLTNVPDIDQRLVFTHWQMRRGRRDGDLDGGLDIIVSFEGVENLLLGKGR
jgi:hypothetical protein